MNKLAKFHNRLRTKGLIWTALYTCRAAALQASQILEQWIIRWEMRRFLSDEESLSSHYNAIQQNKVEWDTYDWSLQGEEWTKDLAWKQRLVEELIQRRIKPNSAILEIGPGAGRWSQELLTLARRLVLADIAPTCLDICSKRFGDDPRVEYLLIGNDYLRTVDSASFDVVWSYDVFVHINPHDTEMCLQDIARLLKPGGIGITHHPHQYANCSEAEAAFRSKMTGPFFTHLVERHGMKVIEQNTSLVHKPGDMISIFQRPPEQ